MTLSGALAVRRADAVGAGVAAADDDDVLARRGDLAPRRGRPRHACWPTRYSIAKCTPARSRPGIGRSRGTVAPVGDHDRVVARAQVVPVMSMPISTPGAEPRALVLHLAQPAVEVALLHLEVGDAVAQQAADAVVALEDRDGVAGAGQLLRGGQAGGAGADDGDGLAGEPHAAARARPSPRRTPRR